jgi:hypothetical protein
MMAGKGEFGRVAFLPMLALVAGYDGAPPTYAVPAQVRQCPLVLCGAGGRLPYASGLP